ncbi:MAG: glycosyltransferase family 4 protein [Pseudomonadota bacterium]
MTARPMTVLQVVPELETGGAERTTVDVAAALVKAGDRALVVSEGGRMVDELTAVGAEHITMPVKTKAIFAMRRNAADLAALAEREAVDIIHARSRAPAWSALWAASWTYRPFVTTFHGAYNQKSRLKAQYNSVMARGDIVIANSAFTAALIAERHPFAASRIVTIHRGVDLSKFDDAAEARGREMLRRWKVDPREPVILHLARLSPFKGQELVLDALVDLDRVNPRPWVCVFAGDDQGRTEFRDRLIQKVDQLNLKRRVRIVGHVDDVPAAYAATTVAIQPSLYPETFGRAAVEAQAAGVPVIVSDHGAVRETVLAPPDVGRDRRTGWRVPPGEAEGLTEALFEALQASSLSRKTIGARGRAHALTHFSLEAMTGKTLGVYHSLLEDDVSALY